MQDHLINNMVVYTATYGNYDRLENFLNDYESSKNMLYDLYKINCKLVIVNTGKKFNRVQGGHISRVASIVKKVRDKPRAGRDAYYHKLKAAEPLLNDKTILVSFADDVAINPYALAVMWKVYKENPQVNFLSAMMPMEGDGEGRWSKVMLSGFEFIKAKSMLGGASSYRWRVFRKYIYDYIKKYNIDGESAKIGYGISSFDATIWDYIDKICGGLTTYNLISFGLVQHCNYVSHYLDIRRGKMNHYYSKFYDPYCNPFELVGVEP
jgi:hypothetical protein